MRPKKEEHLKRCEHFKVNVTLQEKQQLLKCYKKERYPSISEFLRSRILNASDDKHITVSKEYFILFRTLEYQQIKIGNNLNQLAHKLNAYNTYMLNDEDKQAIDKCLQLQKELLHLLTVYLDVID